MAPVFHQLMAAASSASCSCSGWPSLSTCIFRSGSIWNLELERDKICDPKLPLPDCTAVGVDVNCYFRSFQLHPCHHFTELCRDGNLKQTMKCGRTEKNNFTRRLVWAITMLCSLSRVSSATQKRYFTANKISNLHWKVTARGIFICWQNSNNEV